MNSSIRQGGCLALVVLCLGLCSSAAAQTPASGWQSLDIGTTTAGATGAAADGFSLSAAGTDIWNQSDEFRYVYRPLSGDGVIIARVASLSAPDAWSKAGLMIRESLSPGSKHASILRTGSQGLVFQHRGATNDWSTHDAAAASSGAIWVKLERQGSTLIGSYSVNAIGWTRLAQISVAMNASVYVGLAVTGHSAAYASAEFTDVYASDATNWESTDIGSVSYAGATASTGGTLFQRATGADVWGSSDQFRFAYRPLTGDGAIVARVTNLAATDAWTKAGVMIRETLNPDSKHAFMLATGSQGLAFQRRAVGTGAFTDHTGVASAARWLKVERRGSTLTASYSSDGASWTQLGSDTISMAATVYAGIALSSHTSWAYAAAEFSNASLSGSTGSLAPAPAPASSAWTSADVGAPVLAGSTSYVTDGVTITAGGTDIWGGSDQFRFAYQQMTGDGSIVALVRNLNAADPWSKAGVMIRETLAASSPHAFMFLSGTQGGAFQRRRTAGGATSSSPGPSTGFPFWVRLQRSGSTITGSYSWDGVNWATAGSDTIAMGSTVYVGLALTSHSTLAYSTAYFSNASIGSTGGAPAPAPAPASGNQPPLVSLTSPSSGATFPAWGSIAMSANASDADNGIAVVEFYSGPVLLGSDTSSPYSFTVNNVPPGTYSLLAVARDNAGAMTVSSERNVSVGTTTTRPIEAVFYPSSNQSIAVSQYVLSIFPAGADPYASNPVASSDLGLPPTVGGEIHADITAVITGLAPGSYVSTVTAIGPGGEATSAPSPPFTR